MSFEVKRRHQDLQVWQAAMNLAKATYGLTDAFPKEEIYGLTSQMRRAAVSIPSNIAEGAARNGQKEFLQFLSIARSSLMELETQLILSHELGFFQCRKEIMAKTNKVFALLNGLIKSIRNREKEDKR